MAVCLQIGTNPCHAQNPNNDAPDASGEPAPSSLLIEPTPLPAGNLFRIAHVRSDLESPVNTDILDRLRTELSNTPEIRTVLADNGFADIVIQSADSYQNLIDSLNLGQPDLAFCTSVAFVTQTGQYDVLFQIRRPGDPYNARGDRVLHRGVIFVGNRSPLFQKDKGPEALADALSRGPVAMVGSFSAAGYVYPALSLRSKLRPGQEWRPPLFLDSSDEVVKAVLSGSVEVGACDASALDRVLKKNGLDSMQLEVLRVLDTTQEIPTDPVILRTRWRPSGPGGPPAGLLGRAIRDGIRRFFHRQVELPRLEPAARERYQEVAEAYNRLRSAAPAEPKPTSPPESR